jgi:trk system potassium uptake protein TrkA
VFIIILGAGDVGMNLAKMLTYERNDIVVVENNPERFARASDLLDAQVIQGSGSSYRILEQAGIESADMLVAVTNSDEVNILSAIMARQYDVRKTVARVKNLEYLDPESPINAEKFNIELLIHPESEAAKGAIRLLKQSAASDIIEFGDGQIVLMGIQLDRNLPILNRPLNELAREYSDLDFRIIAIQRKETTKIPGGDDIVMANDRVFVVFPKDQVKEVVRLSGKENTKIENVMILGGGQTGFLIAKELEKTHNVKIIESDTDKSTLLAERLKKSLVIKGDGRDLNLLALEGIIDMDAFISVTGDDETNIVSCLMAKHLRVPKIISLINKSDYTPIIPTIGIDAYISKQMLTVNGIMKFIRRGNIVSVASIPGISAEAIEMIASKGSKITKKPLKDVKFPKDAIVGAVMHGEEVLIPVGDTVIEPEDKVVLFALPSAINEVEKLFN